MLRHRHACTLREPARHCVGPTSFRILPTRPHTSRQLHHLRNEDNWSGITHTTAAVLLRTALDKDDVPVASSGWHLPDRGDVPTTPAHAGGRQ